MNRGEPALRLLTAVRELPVAARPATVALLTPGDLGSPVARAADEVVVLPVPPAASATAAYLDLDRVMAALDEARADAVWVGWGFLAENAGFCRRVEATGRTFIGPTPDTLAVTGDKVAAKRLAESVGAPVVPWSGGFVATLADAHAHAARIGYPVIVKAAAGGGGRGIRVATVPADLPDAFTAAATEAERGFGDGRVFIEACVGAARHLEVQIAGDGRGRVLALGVRDCTTQRRHQKVVEECPGPFTTPELRRDLEGHALRIAKALDYRSLGTFEFIADVDPASPRHGAIYFMEVNPRLQVEHTVTEEVFGLDLVKLQLHLAAGGDLPVTAPEARGAAVQVRLCAEDPDRGDVPAPGRVAAFAPARGPGVRVDSALAPGLVITADFDSMIAKVIARGADRAEAIARVQAALGETTCLVEDGATNKGLLLDVLAHPDFQSGRVDTRWLDRVRREGRLRPADLATEALVVAGVLSYRAAREADDDAFHDALARGYPQRLPPAHGRTFQLGVRGERRPVHVFEVGASCYRVRLEGLGEVTCETDADVSRARFGDTTRRVRHHVGPRAIVVELDDRGITLERDAGGVLRAPAPALVIAVLVKVGDVVAAGQRLATLESMKLEMPLRATEPGRVARVFARPNATLAKDDPVVAVEPVDPDLDPSAAPTPPLAAAPTLPPPPLAVDPLSLVSDPAGEPSEAFVRGLAPAGVAAVHAALVAEIDAILLGYDLDPDRAERVIRLLASADLWDAPLFAHRPRDLVDRIVTYADLEWLLSDRELRGVMDAPVVSMETAFYVWARHYLRGPDAIRADYRVYATRAAQAYGRFGPDPLEPDPSLRALLVRMALATARTGPRAALVPRLVVALLELAAHLAEVAPLRGDRRLERALMQIRGLTDDARLAVADEAAETHHVVYQRPRFADRQGELGWLLPGDVPRLVDAPVGLMSPLCRAAVERRGASRAVAAEAFARRFHNHRELGSVTATARDAVLVLTCDALALAFAAPSDLAAGLAALAALDPRAATGPLELATWVGRGGPPFEALAAAFQAAARATFGAPPERLTLLVGSDTCSTRALTLRPGQAADGGALVVDVAARDVHPDVAQRLGIARLEHFDLERQPSAEGVFAWLARARTSPEDQRLLVYIEVKDVYASGALAPAPSCLHSLEHALRESMSALRRLQSLRGRERLHANEITLVARPPIALPRAKILELVDQMPVDFKALGLDRFMLRGHWAEPGEAPRLTEVVVTNPSGHQLEVRLAAGVHAVHVASAYDLKVRRARRLDVPYPYELVRLLTSDPGADTPERLAFPRGAFEEWDVTVDPDGETHAAPVARAPGLNTSAVVFGLVTHFTDKHPDGMTRVLVLSDPLRGMGALAEPECRRLVAAFDLAAERQLPLEWVPVSSGARIAMDTGTENLDWTARVLRRIIEFTAMRGTPNAGVVHVVVDGVNVGAQSYFDAEAALLMHTRGALIMTRRGAMVLTGKKALDFSGGVSAADERGIGGWERIMGPNGEAHYFAHDLGHAFRLLLQLHDVGYVQPGERRPRRRPTTDPAARDPGLDAYPAHLDGGFRTVAEIFADEHNRDKKRSFDIRTVMGAVVDRDGGRLERWAEMRDADTAVVWDAHIGGEPATVIGFESRPLPRHGAVPGDGPTQWTAGTLFPLASKKVARALNAASGNRPVVVLANLSGFDGSPESMRNCQLEWGAEIGRAVVGFDGPILFYVVGRYHGGAYVVFSKALNDNLYAAALEGTFASVIGGAPAAAVVFPREVRARTLADPRVVAARKAADELGRDAEAELSDRQRAAERYREVFEQVHAEKLGAVAREFDEVHSVARARAVGSLDAIVAPPELRSHIASTLATLRAS